MKRRNKLLFVLASLPAAVWAQKPLTLDDFLSQIEGQYRGYQAYDASLEAAKQSQASGDLELSPVLTLEGSYLNDKANSMGAPTIITDKTQTKNYKIGIAKQFSTGTSVAVNSSVTQLDMDGRTQSNNTPFSYNQASGGVGVSISQSLWKNFFGNATRLRWKREDAARDLNVTGVSVQRKQSLIDAEATYWDYLYTLRALEVRKVGLDRARKIETWTRRRLENGIGDRSDLYNTQSLVATREMELIGAEDDKIALEKKLRHLLNLPDNAPLPKFDSNLSVNRKLENYVDDLSKNKSAAKIVSVDAYLSSLESTIKQTVAAEAKDSLRPDLVLAGSYSTNKYDTDMAKVQAGITDNQRPTQAISLKLTWLLDWDTKNQVRDAAAKDALAAKLRKEQSWLEGVTSWEEIQRRHAEMGKRVQSAQLLSELQGKRAATERDKLSKGRSVTFQVIEAEQDASEAELGLGKLQVEQRKLESRARLFVKVEENL